MNNKSENRENKNSYNKIQTDITCIQSFNNDGAPMIPGQMYGWDNHSKENQPSAKSSDQKSSGTKK